MEVNGPLTGAGVIVVRNGRLLAHLRHPSKAGGGKWSVPGGAVELNETIVEAAERELLEETGLIAVEPRVEGFCEHVAIDGMAHPHWITFYVVCKAVGEFEIKEPDKCLEMRWVFPEEFVKMDLFLPNLNLLKKDSQAFHKAVGQVW